VIRRKQLNYCKIIVLDIISKHEDLHRHATLVSSPSSALAVLLDPLGITELITSPSLLKVSGSVVLIRARVDAVLNDVSKPPEETLKRSK
jgi:hypothetical protein